MWRGAGLTVNPMDSFSGMAGAMRVGLVVRKSGLLVVLLLLLALLGGLLVAGIPDACAASGSDKRRVEIGLKIFRATLAADTELRQKLDSRQRLVIVFFYRDDRAAAEGYADKLVQPGGLLEHELRVELSDDPRLQHFAASPPAAVFITEPRLPPGMLQSLQAFCDQRSRLLYSPFEADVERGVPTGLFIGARVQPFVNMGALRASGVRLKDFFLGIAKTTD